LGISLELLLSKRDIKHLYLYESDLDLFHYSLYSIDWQDIFRNLQQRWTYDPFFLGVQPEEFTTLIFCSCKKNGYFLAPETYLFMGYNSPENDKAF